VVIALAVRLLASRAVTEAAGQVGRATVRSGS
jgi:hypothetical protein